MARTDGLGFILTAGLALLLLIDGAWGSRTSDLQYRETGVAINITDEALGFAAGHDNHGTNEDKEPLGARGLLNRTFAATSSSSRNYLNGLVSMSVKNTKSQLSNIVLMRTHKTGSTTLGTLLYRYGTRHRLKVAHFSGAFSTITIEEAAKRTRESHNRVDIMHYHIGDTGPLLSTWEEARSLYGDVMRDPDNITFITILREPRHHLMSYYSYFIEPISQVPIEEFLARDSPDEELLGRLRNAACQEFGVHNSSELQGFLDNSLDGFQLVLISERFDEGLMVLRHLMNWHLIDMTYVLLNQTTGQLKNGKVLKDRSLFESLPQKVQAKIDELTALDKILYDAGVVAFEERLATTSKEQIDADILEFDKLQAVVNVYLESHKTARVNRMYRARGFMEYPPAMYNF